MRSHCSRSEAALASCGPQMTPLLRLPKRLDRGFNYQLKRYTGNLGANKSNCFCTQLLRAVGLRQAMQHHHILDMHLDCFFGSRPLYWNEDVSVGDLHSMKYGSKCRSGSPRLGTVVHLLHIASSDKGCDHV
jgi:hypothetical protein